MVYIGGMLIKNLESTMPVCGEGAAFMSRAAKSSDREIGHRIRNLRIERGLNQQQLGALIGVSGQQMQKYECAKNNLSVAKLLEIARVLDVPPGSLIPHGEYVVEPLSRLYRQFIRDARAVEMAEPELFAALCKMVAVSAALHRSHDA